MSRLFRVINKLDAYTRAPHLEKLTGIQSILKSSANFGIEEVKPTLTYLYDVHDIDIDSGSSNKSISSCIILRESKLRYHFEILSHVSSTKKIDDVIDVEYIVLNEFVLYHFANAQETYWDLVRNIKWGDDSVIW